MRAGSHMRCGFRSDHCIVSAEATSRSRRTLVPVERGKATTRCRALLRCAVPRCARGSLRCSQRAGEPRTRPRAGAISLRELAALGAQTGWARRLALRRSDPPPAAALLAAAEAQRPAPGRGFAGNSEHGIEAHHERCCAQAWAGARRRASAASSSAGARGASADEQESLRTLARLTSRRGLQAAPWVERRLSEHRAQRACAARPRPREGEFGARPRVTSSAEQSAGGRPPQRSADGHPPAAGRAAQSHA